VYPSANRVLVSTEPLGTLGTALAIHQQQEGVIALPQPHIVGAAKGCPYVLSCTVVFVMLNMIRPSSRRADHALIPGGPEKPNYFVASL
jgi:hypothetical protein